LDELFRPHVPIGDVTLKHHDPSSVSVAVVIHEIHEVDELDFSFKAKFTVYFTWTDISMWVRCDGHNEEIDTGKCSFLWRPKPTWANARQMTVVDRRLQSFPELNKALLELTIDGKFSAHMSFHNYPHDYKDLEVEFWLSALAENRAELVFFPVVATFAQSMVRGKGKGKERGGGLLCHSEEKEITIRTRRTLLHLFANVFLFIRRVGPRFLMGNGEYDALSGWMPDGLSIQEESHTVLELNALAIARVWPRSCTLLKRSLTHDEC
jgi:hypothetical protein